MSKEDLRVMKTRKSLMEALVELTIQKSYRKITVQDICGLAMINRSTFYRHYEDKNDLLERYTAEILGDFKRMAPLPGSKKLEHVDDDDLVHLTAFYSFVGKHASFFRSILGEEGYPKFRKMLIDYMSYSTEVKLERISKDGIAGELPVKLLSLYQAHAAMGVIEWWLDGNQSCTAVQTARLHMKMLLGVSSSPCTFIDNSDT